jgi:oligopeptide/dipeptide ABC transporter ATP-binding protein
MPNQDNAASAEAPLLQINNLRMYFHGDGYVSKAVDGVSLTVHRRKTLGIVGESGCGKSVTSMTILRLVPTPPGRVESGEIWFKDEDLLKLSPREMRHIRGNQISMIFQEPMTSLNPVFTIGDQIAEVFRTHQGMSGAQALQEAIRMLELVRIPAASKRAHDYPHQLSGGMRQRVMIAMALACNPELLIADEPTTALDVTVQAQILDLMARLKEDFGSSIMLITHDLGVIAEISDEVAVMYAGQVVEYAATDELFETPMHPYTLGLLASRPNLLDNVGKTKLNPIRGAVPNPARHPSGCRFHPRCPFSTDECRNEAPEMRELREGHMVRCHWADRILEGSMARHEVEARGAG